MAPTKSTRVLPKQTATTTTLLPLARKGLARRTTQNIQDQNVDIMQTRGKRKAEHSPIKNEKIKRSALGNLTNNVKMTNTLHPEEDAKQLLMKKKDNYLFGTAAGTQAQVLKETQNIVNGAVAAIRQQQQQQQQHKITTRATARNANNAKVLDDQTNKILATAAAANVKKVEPAAPAAPLAPHAHAAVVAIKTQHKPVRRISNEFNKTEESLYMSALEDVSSSDSIRLSGNFEAAKRRSALLEKIKTEDTNKPNLTAHVVAAEKVVAAPVAPEGVEDFDKINWNDPFQVSHYAMEIFNYLKDREEEFRISDYMVKQVHLSKWMRSLLVDWMVEVQETFELNHETLYLAVKIVDLYLCRVIINKDKLQLLGAAALFIACKFDERTPPLIEDFLYICDGAYQHDELIHMEMAALKTIDYDLGIPLSYRFLRRYARCAKVPMATLTLARYILELSLMDYATISFSDSKLASAALFMALRLHGDAKGWSTTLEHYTGYLLTDFAEIVPVLNAGLTRRPKGTIKTIRSKYSHKIFHEVAKVTLMTNKQFFANNEELNASIQMEINITS